jgi:pimeloyl-ACP methyl ester carboxylesterase
MIGTSGAVRVSRLMLLDGKNYRSLFMIDPLAIAPWGSPLPLHARRHEAAFAELPAYVHRAIVPAYIAEAIHKPLRPEAMALYAEPWFTERGQPAFWRQIAQFDEKYTDEVEPNYNQVRCPVMILWGEQDRLISVKDGSQTRFDDSWLYPQDHTWFRPTSCRRSRGCRIRVARISPHHPMTAWSSGGVLSLPDVPQN